MLECIYICIPAVYRHLLHLKKKNSIFYILYINVYYHWIVFYINFLGGRRHCLETTHQQMPVHILFPLDHVRSTYHLGISTMKHNDAKHLSMEGARAIQTDLKVKSSVKVIVLDDLKVTVISFIICYVTQAENLTLLKLV